MTAKNRSAQMFPERRAVRRRTLASFNRVSDHDTGMSAWAVTRALPECQDTTVPCDGS